MADEMANDSTVNMNEDIPHTCGVCETIINKNDLGLHPCFEGYTHFYVDDNFYCYPQCQNGDIVRNSLMADGSEAVVVTNAPVNTQRTEPTSLEEKKVALEEQLIDEVFRRPGLWNFKLPLTERSPQIKKKLWEEVFATLDGTLSIDAMKRKWKSLSDTFRIHLKKEQQVASGSAAKSGTKLPWVHFQRLQFLRDLQLQNKTVSNIEPLELDDSDSLEIASLDNSSSSSTNRGSYGKRRSTDDVLDRIAESLTLPISLNMDQIEKILPHPQTDKPTLIGNLVAAQLREIDPELLDEVMLDILKITTDAKKKKNERII